MLNAAVSPPKIMPSLMGPALPPKRAAEAPGIASLEVKELFPDIPDRIYIQGDDLSRIRAATERALADVDMGMIQAGDSVNLLCSEHGFSILEGEAYAEMLKTIRDVVRDRTGCENIRLRFCVGGALIEAREMIPYFGLAEPFEGRVAGVGPFDRGIPIETEIGTLYGLAKVYDADWIIHAHYDDPRETYFHRLVGRSLKAFTMSYARLETRSVYHMNFGSRSSNVVPRAIFESPFVQEKFAFTCFQVTSPAGIIGIDADNDHHRLDRRLMVGTLKSYGKMLRLFAEIDACVAVLDAGRWPWYLHAGGVTSGNLLKGPTDYFDMEVGSPRKEYPHTLNPAVKALVVNHAWRELFVDLASWYPTIVTDTEVAKGLPRRVVKRAFIAGDLEKAMEHAYEVGKTDKAILFDGSYGAINLTPALGELLLASAPEVSRRVDEELLPMWLRQRGVDPATV